MTHLGVREGSYEEEEDGGGEGRGEEERPVGGPNHREVDGPREAEEEEVDEAIAEPQGGSGKGGAEVLGLQDGRVEPGRRN